MSAGGLEFKQGAGKQHSPEFIKVIDDAVSKLTATPRDPQKIRMWQLNPGDGSVPWQQLSAMLFAAAGDDLVKLDRKKVPSLHSFNNYCIRHKLVKVKWGEVIERWWLDV